MATISFAAKKTSYEIHYPTQVNYLLKQINPQMMWKNLSILSDTAIFPDRGSSHQSGVAAANWIINQIKTMAKNYGRDDVTVYTINTMGIDPLSHEPFNEIQPSVMLKIGHSTRAGVVVGAHFDTTQCNNENCLNDPRGPFPGANDDGSGTVALLEMARTIFASGMHFKNPIYLVWYAAEEDGEWGSTAVVTQVKKNNIPIRAVMQLDQIGFAYRNEPTMYLETGKLVNQDLTFYLKTLIETYVKRPVDILNWHGDSDEWSWSDNGFIVARPLEADDSSNNYYKYMHTNEDTISKISLIHMTDYLKLAIAFVVELGEPD